MLAQGATTKGHEAVGLGEIKEFVVLFLRSARCNSLGTRSPLACSFDLLKILEVGWPSVGPLEVVNDEPLEASLVLDGTYLEVVEPILSRVRHSSRY